MYEMKLHRIFLLACGLLGAAIRFEAVSSRLVGSVRQRLKVREHQQYPPGNILRHIKITMDEIVIWNGRGDDTLLTSNGFIDCVPLVCTAIKDDQTVPPFLLSHVSVDDKNFVQGFCYS